MHFLVAGTMSALLALGAVSAASERPAQEHRSSVAGHAFSSHPIEVAVAAPGKHLSPSPSFRGSIAIRVSATAQSANWSKVLAEKGERYFNRPCDAEVCANARHAALASLVKRSQSMDMEDRLAAINSAVNRMITFTSDNQQYGKSDYWATAAETMASRRGDCEDIAIVKMWALRAAGVPPEAIHLILVKDMRRGLDHAILMVMLDGKNFVLDNLHDRLLSADKVENYKPLVSLASDGAWIHGHKMLPASGRIAQRR